MGRTFNNLNIVQEDPEFTKNDVTSQKPEMSKEKIDYAEGSLNPVMNFGKNINTTDSGNTAFNIKFIPREKIQFNPNNDFEIRDIEALADSLLNIGMQHNLGAYYDDDRDRYVLESGERRLRACDQLKEHFENDEYRNGEGYQLYVENIQPFYLKGFPVIVRKAKHQDEDEDHQKIDRIDSDLRKYKANIDVRELTPQERAGYISKVRTLLQERNRILHGEGPDDEKGIPTQAEVAAAVGTSERQIRKYDALNNLVPALREEFEAGNIGINKVPGIAALPEDEQMIFLDLLQKGQKIDPAQVKLYQDHMAAAEQAKKEVEDQKAELEVELDRLRSSKDDEIAAILAESRDREDKIREEIEVAVKEKNEDLIMKLQNDLARERESSGRLVAETNRSLESTKNALDAANKQLEELSKRDRLDEDTVRMKAQIAVQLDLLGQMADKALVLMQSYREKTNLNIDDVISDKSKLESIKEILDLFS